MGAKYRSQWPRGLRRGSAVVRLLGLWVRIPSEAWMSVSWVVCCQAVVPALGWYLVQRRPAACGVWVRWRILHNEETLVHCCAMVKKNGGESSPTTLSTTGIISVVTMCQLLVRGRGGTELGTEATSTHNSFAVQRCGWRHYPSLFFANYTICGLSSREIMSKTWRTQRTKLKWHIWYIHVKKKILFLTAPNNHKSH